MADRHQDPIARAAVRFVGLPTSVHALVIVVLLGLSWVIVYAAGGTRTAFPHVFYFPIVFAALPFGVTGGAIAAVAATVLCGPVMPLDVATGETQAVANWLIRGGFFLAVGIASGVSTATLQRRFAVGLNEQLAHELALAVDTRAVSDDGEWNERVRDVLDHGRFHPVFQPIYALDDGRLLAVEALTRFDAEPQQPPNVWFTHAAHAGLGIELELAAIDAALAASRTLPDGVALTFNASPATLGGPRLAEVIAPYSARRLIAEVTEHAIVDDYPALALAVGELRRAGVAIAVDDTGAGFASLRHIVRLKPDYIKLDTSLTQNLQNDPVRRPLAESLVQFARRTNTSIIVEGIETSADLSTWRGLRAHAGQGFYLGYPDGLPVARRAGAINGKGR